MANSFIENANYVASLDNAYGDSASFTKTNISFRGSSADVKFSMSYYDNTDMKIKSIETLMQNALYSDLTDILTQFKNSIELISGFTCSFTISNDNNAYLVNSISFSITSSDSEKKITKVNFNMTKNGIELYDTYGKINNPIKILPHLALYDDILKSSIININTFKDEVLNVNSNIISINTVSDSISHIITVLNNIDIINSVATDIVPNLAEILQSNISASISTTQANLATTKANEASASELNASISEANALASEANVQAMKLAVETIYDSFDDRFLGAFDYDPVIDNDGNPLLNGTLYFNTISNALKVYAIDITTWVTIPQIYLSSLLDVELTSISAGQILVWNGTKWTNSVITKAHIGLANVDNTSDADKPISTATQNALNTKVDTSTNQTIGGVKTFSSTIIGSINGNAATTTAVLAMDNRSIKPVDASKRRLTYYFTSNGGLTSTANTVYGDLIALNSYSDTTGGLINGLFLYKNSKRILHYQADMNATTWGTPHEIAYTTDNVASASKLETARTITLTGDVTGNVNFDGSANVSLVATVGNDSHTHEFTNLMSKPTTLQGYGITPEEMPASINLDTKTITGIYSQSLNAEAALDLNYPVALAGVLEVFAYSSMIHQRYWVYNSNNVYYRAKYNNGAWTPWTKGANVDDTVAAATKLATARTISLSGDVTGSVSFNGSANVSIATTVADGSHNHIISNVDGLETALNSKANQATTYTKTEVDSALALKVDDTEIASVNLLRADKYLAAQNVVNMAYNVDGKLSKVQYNNATDVDYEVLTYNVDGKLTNVAHYVGSVLKGNTVFSYVNGKLVSVPFTAV